MRRTIQRFEIVGLLGRGGTGAVYRARDPRLERDVAIKLLAAPELVAAPSSLTTHDTVDLRAPAASAGADGLLGEARMMARLSHPNVVPIYEVGLDDHACLFLVMELVTGGNLRSWLAEPRTSAAICNMFAQAARGLAAAHARGIVHRDFKPDNVLVDEDGRARVADFGLSGIAIGVPAAMVRIADGRGTPRFMAPELVAGAIATASSDVYALCRALDDALADRGDLPAALRAAITAGLAADPAARPPLARLIALLDPAPTTRGRRTRARGLALVLLAAAGAAAAVVAVAERGGTASCADLARAPAAEALAAVRAAFTASKLPGADAAGQRATAALAASGAELARAMETACSTELARACFARRGNDLAALAASLASAPIRTVALAEARASYAPLPAAACAELAAPAPVADRALYDRLAQLPTLPPGVRVEAATRLARDATAAEDRELEARAELELGDALGLADRLADADAALARAHQLAVAIHASALIAHALVDQSRLAMRRGDLGGAQSYTKLAAELLDRPSLGPRDQLRIRAVQVRLETARGELPAALRDAAAALEFSAAHGSLVDLEPQLRVDRILATAEIEGKRAEALALAEAHVRWARVHAGVDSADYGIALNLLGSRLQDAQRFAEALVMRSAALAVTVGARGPESSASLLQRSDLGTTLLAAGKPTEARDVFQGCLDATDRNEALRKYRGGELAFLADATHQLGDAAGSLDLLARALDEDVVAIGRDHPETLAVRFGLVDQEIDLDRLDDAARNLAALEESYGRRPESTTVRMARAQGDLGARLALARGDARGAEQLARAALVAVTEVHGEASERIWILRALGRSLAAQHRLADASAALDEALALAVPTQQPDDTAEIEVARAEVAFALGDRADAIARVTSARAQFATHPWHPKAAAQADALAARLGIGARR